VRDNILRSLRADQLSAAIALLPPCDAGAPSTTDVVVYVAELGGRIRVTFARFDHKRGKLRRRFWTPERAERID
jgi:hypothetical protein